MKRKKKIKIIWSILALILTIILALFLPQLIFYIQDYKQMNTVAFDDRETFEILTTETTYSRDMNTRMSTLARVGYGNVTISKLARSIDINEFNNLLSNIKNQTYMRYLEEMLPSVFENAYLYLNATQVETCDCYMVYDSDYQEGVILIFWYMVFDIPELDGKMELIVDSETESIYYIRLLSDKVTAEAAEEVSVVMNGTDFYNMQSAYGATASALMPEVTAELELVVENFPAYFNNYYCQYYGIYYISMVDTNGADIGYAENKLWQNIAVGENEYTMAYALPYGGNNYEETLFFRFFASVNKESGTDISIGLPIIRRFVQS